MLGTPSHDMLLQAEQGIKAKLDPKLQQPLQKVLNAGATILYSPKLKAQLQQKLASTKDPVQEAATGAARMISNVYQQSGKTMPLALIVPAAMIFAFEYLDLLAKTGKADITPQMIAQTTQAVGDAVLPLFGVTKDKLAQLMAQAKSQGGAAPAPAPAAGIIGGAQ